MKSRAVFGEIKDTLMTRYHDDQRIFEFLVLEGMQAGLSWRTILHKRENFRRALDGFDPVKVAAYGDAERQRLMEDPSIIRNRLKIDALINNAQRFLEVQREFGSFDRYIWGFTGHRTLRRREPLTRENTPATSPESDALSKDLKARGFKFMGSIVVYSHMQATGMVNDHRTGCFRALSPK